MLPRRAAYYHADSMDIALALAVVILLLLPLVYLATLAERVKETNALLRHIIDLQWGPEEAVKKPKKTA